MRKTFPAAIENNYFSVGSFIWASNLNKFFSLSCALSVNFARKREKRFTFWCKLNEIEDENAKNLFSGPVI